MRCHELLLRFFTAPRGVLCPLGYGVINGNGIALFKNPFNGLKTLVVSVTSANLLSAAGSANVIKLAVNADGSAYFNASTSPMFFSRMSMDAARFSNSLRPSDLYVSNNRYKNPFVSWNTPEDASTAVQVFQLTEAQWNVNASVPAAVPTLRFCSPSAGPIASLDDIRAGRSPSQSNLFIKLYDSADCDPQTAYSIASDPSALNLAPGVSNPISVPFTANACNDYNQNGLVRSFKMRCLQGEQSNGILLSQKYFFADYSSNAACLSDNSPGGIPQTPPGQPSFVLNPIYGAFFDAGA
jgi:hypothetical protein